MLHALRFARCDSPDMFENADPKPELDRVFEPEGIYRRMTASLALTATRADRTKSGVAPVMVAKV